MDLQLSGKTALVTGASQGIGRAIAIGLAAEGVRVAIAARRVELLNKLAQEIQAAGNPEPVVVVADLYKPETPQRLADEARRGLGRIDILMNVGGGSVPVPVDGPVEKWRDGMELNFFAVRALTHAVLPGMIENRWGRVISLTGGGATEHGWGRTQNTPERALNVAHSAKAALHAWSKALSCEVAKYGVTMNILRPGSIMSEQLRRRFPTEEMRREYAQKENPMGRFGEPEELANLAVFMASPKASFINGAVTSVNGGTNMFAF